MNNNYFERIVGYSSIKKVLEQIVDIIANKDVYGAVSILDTLTSAEIEDIAYAFMKSVAEQ